MQCLASPTRLSPRWTCLPSCQHCTEVALVVLLLLLVQLQFKATLCNFSHVHLNGLNRSLWWITSCNSTQVHFGNFEVQNHLGGLEPESVKSNPDNIGPQLMFVFSIKHHLARSCFQLWPSKSAPRVTKFREKTVSASASPVFFSRNFATLGADFKGHN